MASALVVTPGDGSANSYCSRAVANTYHENRLHAATWTDADDGHQRRGAAHGDARDRPAVRVGGRQERPKYADARMAARRVS